MLNFFKGHKFAHSLVCTKLLSFFLVSGTELSLVDVRMTQIHLCAQHCGCRGPAGACTPLRQAVSRGIRTLSALTAMPAGKEVMCRVA